MATTSLDIGGQWYVLKMVVWFRRFEFLGYTFLDGNGFSRFIHWLCIIENFNGRRFNKFLGLVFEIKNLRFFSVIQIFFCYNICIFYTIYVVSLLCPIDVYGDNTKDIFASNIIIHMFEVFFFSLALALVFFLNVKSTSRLPTLYSGTEHRLCTILRSELDQ